MTLRDLTLQELHHLHRHELREAFPPEELKPFAAMKKLYRAGVYHPVGAWEGETLVGYALLWEAPQRKYVLIDDLGVTAARRNGGLGSVILEKLREAERGNVIFGESEIPCYAPDPAMAERRLGFYARNGARTAGYDTEMFGVPYKTLYWAEGKVDESALMEEHRFVYASTFAPDKFRRYVRIPFDPNGTPGERVSWQQ